MYSFENGERPETRWPKYSQNLLDCRPNNACYAFLRPGQIQLAHFLAAGRIKDIKEKSLEDVCICYENFLLFMNTSSISMWNLGVSPK